MKLFKHLMILGICFFNLACDTHPSRNVERPNIVLIMVDDMGYSDIGCYGGEIDTPHLNSLASSGLLFTQFYNNARCCPTRASLMTGLYPHQTGIGHMTNTPKSKKSHDTGHESYRGFLNRQCVTIGEVLQKAGYHTLMTGKWHLGYHGQDKWPLQRGFDKFYGIIPGASHFFNPLPPRGLTLGNEAATHGKDYYTTDAFTDYALQFIDESHKEDAKKPFFLYLAYTAPHWPLHARIKDIEKYKGKFSKGWNKLREERLERMKKIGIVPQDCRMTIDDAPTWDSVDEAKRKKIELQMEIYAAMIDRVDQNIGHLISKLKKLEKFDNTLIMFLSDNGACAEGGTWGRGDFETTKTLEKNPTALGYEDKAAYGRMWANLSNTPYKRYKRFAHEGGICTPMIAHWPKGIKNPGRLTSEPAHVIDFMATVVELAHATYPKTYKGNAIKPLVGLSLAPLFKGQPQLKERSLLIEHEGNCAIRKGPWKLVSAKPQWELYNIDEDRSETTNLAKKHPEKVKELSAEWSDWARRNKVLVGPKHLQKKRPVKR